jgi:hypothetical protein
VAVRKKPSAMAVERIRVPVAGRIQELAAGRTDKAAHTVAAAGLWRKRQSRREPRRLQQKVL